MTDIVERLRAMSAGRCEGSEWGAGTCAIAADEIERLRAERDMWRQENLKKQIACEQMGARIVALEAEAERLREASEAVLDYLLMPAWLDKPGGDSDVWAIRKSDLRALRAALAKEPDHD